MSASNVVYIVDDDAEVRDSLSFLLRSAGFEPRAFASGEELLAGYDPATSSCIILDLRLAGMNGLAIQAELSARGAPAGVIVISGDADVPSVVKAVKSGAIDVLQKPLNGAQLLNHVREALNAVTDQPPRDSVVTARIARLSPRQREVMKLLLNGKSSKDIAKELGIRPKTLEKHRASILSRMEAENVLDLMRLVLAPRFPATLESSQPRRKSL